MLKGAIFYVTTVVLGSRLKRKREPGDVPHMSFLGASVMMGYWSFVWLGLCIAHSSRLPMDTYLEYVDPFYNFTHNWQIPLLFGVLSIFCTYCSTKWKISLEQDLIVIRRWPMRTKSLELSKLRGLERYRSGTGAALYFKGEPDFKINSFMSGQKYFLDALTEYLAKRGRAAKKEVPDGMPESPG